VAVADLVADLELPALAEVLGPVAAAPSAGPPRSDRPGERMLIRVPRAEGAALASALKAAQAGRSARKAAGSVRVELDPAVLG
jgi:primosomal protein N' (replication factor Y) (superfamily II helicase)